MRTSDPMIPAIAWGGGEPIPGTPFRQIVTGAQTGGHLVVLAVDMPAHLRVDEHTHADEDQIMIVIRGAVGAAIDGSEVLVGEGGVVCMPRDVPHELWNPTDEPARVLEIYTPSGFERVFEQAGALALSGSSASGDDLA